MGRIIKTLGTMTAVLGLVFAVPMSASAATATPVYDINANGWTNTDTDTNPADAVDNRPQSSAALTGKYQAPKDFGSGALTITTSDESGKNQVMYTSDNGKLLSEVGTINYWTYRDTGQAQQVTALNIAIDVNGPDVDGGFTTLVFEPVYNTGQGPVLDKQWQDWDAGNEGMYWSTRDIPGAPANTYVTLAEIKAANLDATIYYYGFNQGSSNPGLTAAVDGLTFGDRMFNFEQPAKATNKDDCKNNGWRDNFTTKYKNQGDCVSSVASKNKSTEATQNQSLMDRVRSFFGM